jgi:hypothetical protein
MNTGGDNRRSCRRRSSTAVASAAPPGQVDVDAEVVAAVSDAASQTTTSAFDHRCC